MPAITTLIPVSAASVLPAIRLNASEMGAEVVDIAGGARIVAIVGIVEAVSEGTGLRVTVRSDDAEGLSALRHAIDHFVEDHTMPEPVWQDLRAGAPARLHVTEVTTVTRISPNFTRVRLTGDFSSFREGGLHFRLLLGPDGAGLPSLKADGIHWPGGIDVWHRPPYTIRAMDPGASWLDFDIFLHEGGRVTEWCEDVRPGDAVGLTGPGGRSVKQAPWLGLVGDETALPVLMRAVEAAGPETCGQVYVIISDPADAQDVAVPPGLTLEWVTRTKDIRAIDLFRRLNPPAEGRQVFFAGERQEAEAAREHARTWGLTNGEFHAANYWTEGWVPPATQRQAKRG